MVGALGEGAADGAHELGLLAPLGLEEAVELPVLDEGERRASGLGGGVKRVVASIQYQLGVTFCHGFK